MFLALAMFLAGAMPGVVAAAQGVQLQAPLCTPNGPEPAKNSGPASEILDHCQICPLANSPGADARIDYGHAIGAYLVLAEKPPKVAIAGRWVRAELTPLNGRAPPLQG